jgi:nitroreductase/NAD-dependent dihydropyrimidine dehydrogenase PreA subunit
MALFTVDMDKCVKCGACSEVCLSKAVVSGNDGPEPAHDICIRCGHCVAVCPTAAIQHSKAPLAEQTPRGKGTALTGQAAEEFLRARVSVRKYQNKPVPREEVEQVLNIAKHALTARNSQGISYVVIDDPTVLACVKEAVVSRSEYEIEHGLAMDEEYDPCYPDLKITMAARYRKDGEDTVLWGAPCLILALADKTKALNPREGAVFCLTYAHLYAQAAGLGCCWAGAVENAVGHKWPPMIEALDMGDDFSNITGALMIGYPKYTYQRLVGRDRLTVRWK